MLLPKRPEKTINMQCDLSQVQKNKPWTSNITNTLWYTGVIFGRIESFSEAVDGSNMFMTELMTQD